MRRLILFLLLTFTAATSVFGGDSLWMDETSLALPEPMIDPVPVPIDSQWWDGFSRCGTTARVTSFASYEGDLIAAGDFREIAGIRTNRIARWDGHSWTTLPSGLSDVQIVAVYDDELIAGTRCACGSNCIYRWNGASWTRIGDGIRSWDGGPYSHCELCPSYVYALAEYDGRLIAGGLFGTGAGNPEDYLAAWDGQSWSSLGSTVNSSVRSMTVLDGKLVVGGRFTEAGSVSANRIATWDGSEWSPLGSGIQDNLSDPWASQRVLALAVYDGCIYAGGVFSKAGSLEVDRLAYWDGSSWNSTGFEAGGYVDGVVPSVNTFAVYDGSLIAGGRFREADGALADFIASWDGESWSPLGPGLDGEVKALMPYGDVLWVGGEFTCPGDSLVNNIAIWDGVTWHPTGGGHGLDRRVRALLVHDGQLITGGNFHTAGSLAANRIAAWDGSSWTTLGEGWSGQEKTVAALRTFEGSPIGVDGKVVRRWDGAHWDTITTEFDGDIRAIEVYQNGIVAASGKAVAAWDGASWAPLGLLAPVDYVAALQVFGDDLVAGGDFTEIDGVDVENVAAWDGDTWRSLGEGLRRAGYGDDMVSVLGVFGGRLIAGGNFDRSGDTEVKSIAAWDGETWSPLDRGLARDLNPNVYALAEYNGTLIAGGDFRYVDGRKAWNIARWNGASWHPIGSGIGVFENHSERYTVDALAAYGGDLYAGGYFKYAGGKNSFYLARWEERFPGMVMDFTATPADSSVLLEWRNPDAGVFEGTLLRYSTSDYPAGPEDGDPVPNSNDGWFAGLAGSDTFFVHNGLENGVTYYYGAFAYDADQAHSMPAWANTVPADQIPPGPVVDFTATSTPGAILLEWTNPSDPDFTETLISVSTTGYPTDPDDGSLHIENGNNGRFEGKPDSGGFYVHSGILAGQSYCYTAWAYDRSSNHSVGAHDSVFIELTTPDTLDYFEARAYDGRVYLLWANPDQFGYNGTYIRFSTVGFPLSVTDGEPVPNAHEGRFDGQPGTWDDFHHNDLVAGVTYYYSGFVRLSGPSRYSLPVERSATPWGPPDETPPGLYIGVLENPYLTQYLDIYLVGSEALDPVSIDVRADGESVAMAMLGSTQRLWRGDYKLVTQTDSFSIDACASDAAGNDSCVSARMSVGLFSTGVGGTIHSPDGRLKLSLPPGAVSQESYVMVIPAGSPHDDEIPRGVTYVVSGKGEPDAYRICPSGLLDGQSALLEITYEGLGSYSGLPADEIYIEHTESGPLECYVDPAAGTVSAKVTSLGTFRLSAGAPGTSRLLDPSYLNVEQVGPNPFARSTSLRFEVRAVLPMRATVYDIRGRRVATLMDSMAYPGYADVAWDGTSRGDRLPSGVYFLSIETPRATSTAKVVLIR